MNKKDNSVKMKYAQELNMIKARLMQIEREGAVCKETISRLSEKERRELLSDTESALYDIALRRINQLRIEWQQWRDWHNEIVDYLREMV